MIRFEAASRWDAVDLSRRLGGHTYLVQLADSRWHVCVRVEGPPDELLDDVMRAAREWASERRVETVLHTAGRDYRIG